MRPSELLGGSGHHSITPCREAECTKYGMRYRDLTEARPWRQYDSRAGRCQITRTEHAVGSNATTDVIVQFGTVSTGKQRVFAGYFCRVIRPDGVAVLGEDPHHLRGALRKVEHQLNQTGWTLNAIALSDDWQETGLSENSGFGYHPAFDRPVHMLESLPHSS